MSKTTFVSGQTRLDHQRGAALVMSLLFLLIMTLIGISAMQGTTLEEKMSASMADRNLALQLAESGLRDGESFIESVTSTAAFAGSNGLFGEFDNPPDPFAAATWTNANLSVNGTPITLPSGATVTPRYFIKFSGSVKAEDNSKKIPEYGKPKPGEISTFQITARASGAQAGGTVTEVMVRSYYGRKF